MGAQGCQFRTSDWVVWIHHTRVWFEGTTSNLPWHASLEPPPPPVCRCPKIGNLENREDTIEVPSCWGVLMVATCPLEYQILRSETLRTFFCTLQQFHLVRWLSHVFSFKWVFPAMLVTTNPRLFSCSLSLSSPGPRGLGAKLRRRHLQKKHRQKCWICFTHPEPFFFNFMCQSEFTSRPPKIIPARDPKQCCKDTRNTTERYQVRLCKFPLWISLYKIVTKVSLTGPL